MPNRPCRQEKDNEDPVRNLHGNKRILFKSLFFRPGAIGNHTHFRNLLDAKSINMECIYDTDTLIVAL